jgi:hypothetical protein
VDRRGRRAHAAQVRERRFTTLGPTHPAPAPRGFAAPVGRPARLHVVRNLGAWLRTPFLRIVWRAPCRGVFAQGQSRVSELFGQTHVGGRRKPGGSRAARCTSHDGYSETNVQVNVVEVVLPIGHGQRNGT